MKNMKSRSLEAVESNTLREKGITLVALVITTIILLILAGVGIYTLTNTGVFEKSKEAKEKYLTSEEKENKILSEYMRTITSQSDKNYDQWTTWLYLAGIDNPEKYSEEEILQNKELMGILLSNENAVDYMIKSTNTIMKEIVNSKTALEMVAQNKNVMNKIVSNKEWTLEIENNKNAIETLKQDSNYTTVPTLTGNTSNVLQSSSHNNSDFWGAWKCFDGKIGSGGEDVHWSSGKAVEHYAGYKFDDQVWMFEVTLNNGISDFIQYGAKKVEVQYSDNNIDYYPASDILNIEMKNELQTLKLNGNTGKHYYWRIYIFEGYANESCSISEIKFNGIK